MRGQHQRQADRRDRERAPDRRPRPEPRDRLAGKERRDDRGQEDEIDEAEIHRARATAAARTRTKLTKVKVPMKANRMQKPMPKAARSAGLRQCSIIAANGDCAGGHRMHRLDALDREINQHRAGEIEQREEIEIRCQAEAVGDRGGNQPADQVARDIAGDIGRERAAGVHRAALFAEIGERQRKRRRHAQALRDAQHRERW